MITMSLQFTSIDDAFTPLSSNNAGSNNGRKKREREKRETEDQVAEQQIQPPPVIQPVRQEDRPMSLADEIFSMQPYINNIFMIIVIGMLYDIRQAALDIKTHVIMKTIAS